MLIASVPFSFCSSTVSINLVLETSVIAFLMYLFSAAVWKYLDAVILLIYFIHVFPFPPCDDLERNTGMHILAHQIRISEILPWDRKSYPGYLTQAVT